MKKPIIVNVQSYGDFDIAVSEAIMVAPENFDIGFVRLLISEFETKLRNSNEVEEAIALLRNHGFQTVKSIDLTIGGNL